MQPLARCCDSAVQKTVQNLQQFFEKAISLLTLQMMKLGVYMLPVQLNVGTSSQIQTQSFPAVNSSLIGLYQLPFEGKACR